jgi:hypothetical protein
MSGTDPESKALDLGDGTDRSITGRSSPRTESSCPRAPATERVRISERAACGRTKPSDASHSNRAGCVITSEGLLSFPLALP